MSGLFGDRALNSKSTVNQPNVARARRYPRHGTMNYKHLQVRRP